MTQRLSKVLKAINQIKLLPSITEALIELEAKELVLFCDLVAIKDYKQSQNCGSKQSIKELQRLITLGGTLRYHINTLHRNTVDSLKKCGKIDPIVTEQELRLLIIQASNSIIELKEKENVRKTKPARLAPPTITNYVAKLYQRLTGITPKSFSVKDSKAEGEYLNFLQDVFDATINKIRPEFIGKKTKSQKASAEGRIRQRNKLIKKSNGEIEI